MLRTVARRVGGVFLATGAVGTTYVVVDPGMRREAVFWRSAAPMLAEYKYVEWWYRGDEKLQETKYNELNQRWAPPMFELFSNLGGLFIKMGQVLSARPEMVPEEFRNEFRKLQSHVTGQPFQIIRGVVESELGGPIESKFGSFDETCVGAASIGQAHHATTLQGAGVIVKVQYPDVAWKFSADIQCMELFAWLVHSEAGPLVQELKRQAFQELDYVQERQNLVDMYQGLMPTFHDKVAVPKPIDALCSPKVLTMTFLEGPKLEEEALRQLKLVGVSFEEGLQKRFASSSPLGESKADSPFSGAAPTSPSGLVTSPPSSPSSPSDASSPVDSAAVDSRSLTSLSSSSSSKTTRFALFIASFAPVRWLAVNGFLYYTRFSIWCRARQLSTLLSLAEASLFFGVGGNSLREWVTSHREEARRLKSLQNTNKWIDTLLAVHGFEVFEMQPALFNADPHPGNILIMPDGRLGLIDYGQCRRMSPEGRLNMARLMLAVADHQDDAAVAKALLDMGCRTANNNERFLATMGRMFFNKIDPKTLDINYLRELSQLDWKPIFPPDLLLAARTALLLRGTAFALGRNVSVAEHWKPSALRALERA